jgi:hypothetical protein
MKYGRLLVLTLLIGLAITLEPIKATTESQSSGTVTVTTTTTTTTTETYVLKTDAGTDFKQTLGLAIAIFSLLFGGGWLLKIRDRLKKHMSLTLQTIAIQLRLAVH